MNRPLPLLLLTVSTLIIGCNTVAVDQTFWNNSNAKVLIILGDIPKNGRVFSEGSQGLLDLAIASVAEQSLRGHVTTIKPTSFPQVAETFKSRLRARGYDVSIYPRRVNLDWVEGPIDIRKYLNETGTDYAITLNLGGFGVARSYSAMIPLSDPIPVANVRGQMFSINPPAKLWDSGRLNNQVKQTVIGEWKQPPGYPNLTSAVERTLASSQKLLVDRFFEGRGDGVNPMVHRSTAGSVIGSSSSTTATKVKAESAAVSADRKTFFASDKITALVVTSSNPYKLTQGASIVTTANTKIKINGQAARISGSSDGNIVFVTTSQLSADKKSETLLQLYSQFKKDLAGSGIKITRLQRVMNIGTDGFFLATSGDGYGLIKKKYGTSEM